jgi:hypothetical protein
MTENHNTTTAATTTATGKVQTKSRQSPNKVLVKSED